MADWKPVRIGVRLLAVLVVLQLFNSVVLVGLLLRQEQGMVIQGEPAISALSPPPSPVVAPTPVNVTLKPGIEGVFQSIVAPVETAMKDMGIDTQALLPSDAEIAAAVATDSLSSPESQAVLDKLRLCYEDQGLPFPRLPGLGETPADGTPPPSPF
jgi:hypothetical protein